METRRLGEAGNQVLTIQAGLVSAATRSDGIKADRILPSPGLEKIYRTRPFG